MLQQFDGNILGPKILGDSIGLTSFWVIFAVIVGGGLFNIMGMFLGVPIFAVIYALFNEYVRNSLEKKKLAIETAHYYNCDDSPPPAPKKPEESGAAAE
ncbi:hypothetical protein SDC9_212736 [bioreactor metagenome]|uniref:AI-2 transport protein TqsA n=1 Tax=bioreactor metagenome TaxID=1076179 RepID=A0A645JNM8_9ZZZZ